MRDNVFTCTSMYHIRVQVIMERKMNKNLTLRMSPEMLSRIERDAAENESTCSQVIRTILARHYRHMEGIEA